MINKLFFVIQHLHPLNIIRLNIPVGSRLHHAVGTAGNVVESQGMAHFMRADHIRVSLNGLGTVNVMMFGDGLIVNQDDAVR